jgi:hypothetical protein
MAGRITWDDDIKDFFTQMDIGCMRARGSVDLSDYESVKKMASSILVQLRRRVADPTKGMPKGDRPWPQEKIDAFDKWTKDGFPKTQTDAGP